MADSEHIIRIKISPESAQEGARQVKAILADIEASEHKVAKVKSANNKKATQEVRELTDVEKEQEKVKKRLLDLEKDREALIKRTGGSDLELFKQRLDVVRQLQREVLSLSNAHKADADAVKLLIAQQERLRKVEQSMLGGPNRFFRPDTGFINVKTDKINLQKHIEETLINPYKKATPEIRAAREYALMQVFGGDSVTKFNLTTVPDKINLQKHIEETLINPYKKATPEILRQKQLALQAAFGGFAEHVTPQKGVMQAPKPVSEQPSRMDELFRRYNIITPEQSKQQVTELKELRTALMLAGKEGENVTASLAKVKAQINNLETGNPRGRSGVHRWLASIASMTFEVTGAIFGIGAAVASITFPLRSGIEFLSTLENVKVGMAGILMSMGRINGESFDLPTALKVSSDLTKDLVKDSMKYGVNLEALATTTRAVMASGFAGGMGLEQIREISTLGTLAVKTIGLDARQSVQEIRDLVAGGIQAASSTLATAIGVRDSDVKRWREAGTLFEELRDRLSGFGEAGVEATKTLSGSFDILKQKIQLLFVDEEAFEGLKAFVQDISNSIGQIDEKTGELKLNEDFLRTAGNYLDVLKAIGFVVGEIVKGLAFVIRHMTEIAVITGTLTMATKLRQASQAATVLGETLSASQKATVLLDSGLGKIKGTMGWFKNLGMASRFGLIGMALFGTFEILSQFKPVRDLMNQAASLLGSARQKPVGEIKIKNEADQIKQLTLLGQKLNELNKLKGENPNLSPIPGGTSEEQKIKNRIALLNREIEAIKKASEIRVGDRITGNTTEATKFEAKLRELAKDSSENRNLEKQKALEELDKGFKSQQADFQLRLERLKTKGQLGPKEFVEVGSEAQKRAINDIIKEQEKVARDVLSARESINKKFADPKTKTTSGGLSKEEKLNLIKADTAQDFDKMMDEEQERADKLKDLQETILFDDAEAFRKQKENEDKRSAQLEGQRELINNVTLSYRDNTNAQIERMQIERDMIGLTAEGIAHLENRTEKQQALTQLGKVYANQIRREGADVNALNEEYQSAIKIIEQLFQAKEKATDTKFNLDRDPLQGIKDGWLEYKNIAETASMNTRDTFLSSMRSMEDSLVQFVKTGKMSMGDFVETVIEGLIRIQIQKAIAGLGGALDASGILGSLGGLFGGGGTPQVAGATSMFTAFPSAFAKGGVLSDYSNMIVNQPTKFANGMGLMGEAGAEAIMPLKRDASGNLGVIASGSSSNVSINIVINNDGTSTQQTSGMQEESASRLADGVKQLVREEILKQSRSGGDLNRRR